MDNFLKLPEIIPLTAVFIEACYLSQTPTTFPVVKCGYASNNKNNDDDDDDNNNNNNNNNNPKLFRSCLI